MPNLAFTLDFELQPFRHGIDGRYAHAVKTSADFVTRIIEFAARVQDGHDNFSRTYAFGMHADGNPATVVLASHRTVELYGYANFRAVPRQMLVHRIVHGFPHQVVQSRAIVYVADVHSRPLTYRLETLERRDAVLVV